MNLPFDVKRELGMTGAKERKEGRKYVTGGFVVICQVQSRDSFLFWLNERKLSDCNHIQR